MNVRTLLLALGALVTAGLTATLVQGWIERQRAELGARPAAAAPAPPATRVLVARRALGAGTLIRPEHLAWRAWPAEGIDSAYAVEGRRRIADFTGAVVRRGLAAGEPLTERRVVKPGERGFLAAVLSPGMRALSIPVNAASGISGLVFPGDRVDLILTHSYEGGAGGGEAGPARRLRRASETVLSNLRVLAIGQSTDDEAGKPMVAKTATVEATPKQAEAIALALELGKLSLSLRSLARGGDGTKKGSAQLPGPSFTRDSDVSRLLRRSPARAPKRVVNVLRGDKAETRTLAADPPKARP